MTTSEYLKNCQRVPHWIHSRVRELVIEMNDVLECRQAWSVYGDRFGSEPRRRLPEALEMLGTRGVCQLCIDLGLSPSLAELVPAEFVKALMRGFNASNLEPLEHAAVIVVDHDSQDLVFHLEGVAALSPEFLQLKWQALAKLLEEPGYGE